MDVIKRTININEFISKRNDLTYNQITANTFSFNVHLTNHTDDMGLFSDVEYIPYLDGKVDLTPLNEKISASKTNQKQVSDKFIAISSDEYQGLIRDIKKEFKDYVINGFLISGQSESIKNELVSYVEDSEFVINYVIDNGVYFNFKNEEIKYVNKVTNLNPLTYTIDGNNDFNLGTINQNGGFVYYEDPSLINNNIIGDNTVDYATFTYKNEGLNETNSSLSAITKEDYLYGLVFNPKIKNEVFIERGVTNPIERHLRLSEIRSLDTLEFYNNKFYNINKI